MLHQCGIERRRFTEVVSLKNDAVKLKRESSVIDEERAVLLQLVELPERAEAIAKTLAGHHGLAIWHQIIRRNVREVLQVLCSRRADRARAPELCSELIVLTKGREDN